MKLILCLNLCKSETNFEIMPSNYFYNEWLSKLEILGGKIGGSVKKSESNLTVKRTEKPQ